MLSWPNHLFQPMQLVEHEPYRYRYHHDLLTVSKTAENYHLDNYLCSTMRLNNYLSDDYIVNSNALLIGLRYFSGQ